MRNTIALLIFSFYLNSLCLGKYGWNTFELEKGTGKEVTETKDKNRKLTPRSEVSISKGPCSVQRIYRCPKVFHLKAPGCHRIAGTQLALIRLVCVDVTQGAWDVPGLYFRKQARTWAVFCQRHDFLLVSWGSRDSIKHSSYCDTTTRICKVVSWMDSDCRTPRAWQGRRGLHRLLSERSTVLR